MRIEELSIGDYFTSKDASDYPECPILQVKGMIDDESYAIYISENESEVFYIYGIDDLKGIPLTPEILEKNGFEKMPRGYFVYEDDDESLKMEFYPKEMNYNGIYDFIDIDRGCITIKELPLMNVHELQHALRLCGIEKEIKL